MCALTAAGQTWCWTEEGPFVLPFALTQPPGVQFTQIAMNSKHYPGICGLTSAGQAWCQGQGAVVGAGLGAAVTTDTFAAVHQGLGVQFQSISMDGPNACAVSTLGQGFCWGENKWGQVGDGSYDTPRSEPVIVSHPASIRFTQIVVGKYRSTCGLATTGQAYCWGVGALGTTATAISYTPVAVEQPAGVLFTRLAAGYEYFCGIAAGNGRVYCWGQNDNGQLGDGSTTSRTTPVPVVRP